MPFSIAGDHDLPRQGSGDSGENSPLIRAPLFSCKVYFSEMSYFHGVEIVKYLIRGVPLCLLLLAIGSEGIYSPTSPQPPGRLFSSRLSASDEMLSGTKLCINHIGVHCMQI